MHRVGGKTFIQLWHIGRAANNDMPEQKQSGHVSEPNQEVDIILKSLDSSSLYRALRQYPFVEEKVTSGLWRVNLATQLSVSLPLCISHCACTRLTLATQPQPLEDPDAVIEEYRQAAENAKKAGFDGVERTSRLSRPPSTTDWSVTVHSANGYLVSQFLDSTSNKRTDEWGGSIENRCRFGLKALDALIDVYGAGKVGIKINPCGGYNDVGVGTHFTESPLHVGKSCCIHSLLIRCLFKRR